MGWSEPPPPPSGIRGVRRGQTLAAGHPAWQRWHDPAVWGTMAGFGHHNLFLGDHKPEADEEWQNGMTHRFWERMANYRPDQHAAALTSMGRKIRSARTAIGIATPALEKVLDSGRIKSGFETNQNFAGDLSGGYYLGLRRNQERRHFGYPNDHPDEGRPVYGFLTHNVFSDRHASMYGAHTLVLSPSIHHRVTWTGADSLNEQSHLRPSPKNAPSLVSIPEYHADTRFGGRDLGIGEHLGDHKSRGSYVEAQVHGGLPLHHVHYAILRAPQGWHQSLDPLKEGLNQLGVPWVHISGHEEAGPEHAVAWAEGSPRRRVGVLMAVHQAIFDGAFNTAYRPRAALHDGGHRYIIELEEPMARGMRMAQVADLEWGVLHPPVPLDSILARGYWNQFAEPVDVEDLLAKVRPVA